MLIITNWTAFIIAVTALIPAVISLLTYLETRKNSRKITTAQESVDVVHGIVNSQRTAMEANIKDLRERLEAMAKIVGGKNEQIAGLERTARKEG